MSRDILIAPSILAANLAFLGDEVRAVTSGGADWIHVDVMDGHFVPNISFGPAILSAIRPLSSKPMDVHLMISPVDCLIPSFGNQGADIITVHIEAGPHTHRTLQAIKIYGKKAGLAINPATPAAAIGPLLDDIDVILVMSVNPGFGGQKFINTVLPKISELRKMIGNRSIDLEVDGGVTIETAPLCVRAGANILVAGSAIFNGDRPRDYARQIAQIRTASEQSLSI